MAPGRRRDSNLSRRATRNRTRQGRTPAEDPPAKTRDFGLRDGHLVRRPRPGCDQGARATPSISLALRRASAILGPLLALTAPASDGPGDVADRWPVPNRRALSDSEGRSQRNQRPVLADAFMGLLEGALALQSRLLEEV